MKLKENNYQKYSGKQLQQPVFNLEYQPSNYHGSLKKIYESLEEDQVIEGLPSQTSLTEDIAPYFPSQELKSVVEYARVLQRPLLLRGEPGSGKTRLAQALAYELYKENYRKYYFEWYIKSSTKAVEGLYHFDHLSRLRDTQVGDILDVTSYRTFGPLGKAFITSTPEKPAILLIDEIDKADLDFPNDLLLELDQKRFFIEETQEEIHAQYPPIIIITSNDEKELPNAFLRRCIFHYIQFPSEEDLVKIAMAKVETELGGNLSLEIVQQIVARFNELYKKMQQDPNTDKSPSTSELLDWLRIFTFYSLKGELKMEESGGILFPDGKLLYPEILLKSYDDYKSQMGQREE